jgi:hypothetical protein
MVELSRIEAYLITDQMGPCKFLFSNGIFAAVRPLCEIKPVHSATALQT